jgi:antitoxin (DNA-binding transcriptional repressor) of toxin-antitoxin stability system
VDKATISQLKNRLSAYLKKVRAGATVVVLDREQPIARIERIDAGGHPSDRLLRLERSGQLRRGRRALRVASLRAELPESSRGVLDALIEDRREDR